MIDQQYRITLLIHIIHCILSDKDPLSESVDAATAEAALRVLKYFEGTAAVVFDEVYQEPRDKKLCRIITFIHEELTKGVQRVLRRQIQQKVKGGKNKVTGSELDQLLQELVKDGILVKSEDGRSCSYSLKSCPSIPIVC